jgi:glycosyltransferase involved in cell wall biosynthesis
LHIVILMLHYYADLPSGSTRLAFDEAVFLSQLGHHVWVVAQDLSRSRPEQSFQDGLSVLRYPSPRSASFDPRRMRIHQQRTMELLARRVGSQVDLIHGHSLLHYDGALRLYGRSARMCYSVHSPALLEMRAAAAGVDPITRLRLLLAAHVVHRIEHRCLHRSDCITADSNYTRDLLGRLHGTTIQRKTRTFPGWVDLERFRIVPDRQAAKSGLGWPTDIPVFFTLRRLVPRMGLDQLIRALYEVKRTGYRFHLVVGGSGPLHAQLERLVVELGLEKRIHLIGFVPDAELPTMYAAADAFVLPTAELECFGLITLEALACGRPVLATPTGAIPEVLGRFERGWLAQDSSEAAIAQLLMDFLGGKLPSREPTELREIVSRHYSRQRALEQLTAAVLDIPSAHLDTHLDTSMESR